MRLRSTVPPAGGTPPPEARGRARRPLGEVMQIGTEASARINERQGETGKLFGETAVELGYANAEQVKRAVQTQQGFAVLNDGDGRIDPLVISAFHPDDPLARMVREVRSILTVAQTRTGEQVQTVALVGLGDPTESSILIASLAVACAQAGHSTVLVDANLDAPAQHMLFRLSNRIGLSTLLSTMDSPEAAAQPSAIPLLSVMTAGPPVPNAPELLDRQRLAQAIDPLRDTFELIIVDASHASTDGLDACAGLDSAVLLMRRDVSGQRALRRTVAALEASGATMLGSIVIE